MTKKLVGNGTARECFVCHSERSEESDVCTICAACESTRFSTGIHRLCGCVLEGKLQIMATNGFAVCGAL
jgi:hypothetical protein